MPVTLSQMATNKASVTLTGEHLGNNTITVVFFPNKINTTAIKQLDEGSDSINQVLADVIVSWDVLEEGGETPLPVTVENLERLGMAIVWQIRMELVKALRPN